MAVRPVLSIQSINQSQQKSRSSLLGGDEDAACRRAMVAFFTCLDRANGSKGCIDPIVAFNVWRVLTRDLDSKQVRSLEHQLQSRVEPIDCEEWLCLMGKICSIGGKRVFMSSVLRAWVLLEEGKLKVEVPSKAQRRACSPASTESKPRKLEPLVSKGDRGLPQPKSMSTCCIALDRSRLPDTNPLERDTRDCSAISLFESFSPSKRKSPKSCLKGDKLVGRQSLVGSVSCGVLEGATEVEGRAIWQGHPCGVAEKTEEHDVLGKQKVLKKDSSRTALVNGQRMTTSTIQANSSCATMESSPDIYSLPVVHVQPWGENHAQTSKRKSSKNIARGEVLIEEQTAPYSICCAMHEDAPFGPEPSRHLSSFCKLKPVDLEKAAERVHKLEPQCKDPTLLMGSSFDSQSTKASTSALEDHELMTCEEHVERSPSSLEAASKEESVESNLVDDVLDERVVICSSRNPSGSSHALEQDGSNPVVLKDTKAPCTFTNNEFDVGKDVSNVPSFEHAGSLVESNFNVSTMHHSTSLGTDLKVMQGERSGREEFETIGPEVSSVSAAFVASNDDHVLSPHRLEVKRSDCKHSRKHKHVPHLDHGETKSHVGHAHKILSQTQQLPAALRHQPLPPLPKVPVVIPWAVRMAKSIAEWKGTHFSHFRIGNVIKATNKFSIDGNDIHSGQRARITFVAHEVSMDILLDGFSNPITVQKKDWFNFDIQIVTHQVELIDVSGHGAGRFLSCIVLKEHPAGFFDILCQDGREALFVHSAFLRELSVSMYTDCGFSSTSNSPVSAAPNRELQPIASTIESVKYVFNPFELPALSCFELPPAGFQGPSALGASPLQKRRRGATEEHDAKRREEPRREVASHAQLRPVGEACESGAQICPFMEIQDGGLRAIMSLVCFGVKDVVVDIGCGHGKILDMILQRFPCQGIGVEVNSSIARVAEQKMHRYAERASIVIDDIRNVDLSGATATVSFMLSHSFEVQGMSLKEHLSKSLRPGSTVFNYTYPVPGWHGSCHNGVWKYVIGEHLSEQ